MPIFLPLQGLGDPIRDHTTKPADAFGSADGLHAIATQLCTWRSQWFGAVPTRSPIVREPMVEYGIGIYLRKSCDSFVLCKHGSKHGLQVASAFAAGRRAVT
jgi:hypothetical protein